jgi:preprotein translocase subunit YajC
MHNFLSIYNTVLAASSSSKTNSSSSLGMFLLILMLGVLAYMFFLRPRSQQARRQRETLQQVSVGDEVLTGAGIFGRVLDVEADRITIETAPGTRITVLRSTIARRLTEHPEDDQAGTEQHGWSEQDEDTTGSGDKGVHDALSDGHHEALSDGQGGDEDHHSRDEHEGEAEHGGDAASSGGPGAR